MRIVTLLAGFLLAVGWFSPALALGELPGCERLLQNYDRAVLNFSSSANRDGVTLQPQIAKTAQRARQGGCVTSDFDILLLNRLARERAGAPIVESGAPIRPTALQVGIVGGVTSEVQARSFFGAMGMRVRSQGAPGLGRRIYLGPFSTAGGLAEAAALAERAGFVAPYPRRF